MMYATILQRHIFGVGTHGGPHQTGLQVFWHVVDAINLWCSVFVPHVVDSDVLPDELGRSGYF